MLRSAFRVPRAACRVPPTAFRVPRDRALVVWPRLRG